MSNESRSGREVLESGLKDLSSFLKSRALPGKAKLNRHGELPLQHASLCAAATKDEAVGKGAADNHHQAWVPATAAEHAAAGACASNAGRDLSPHLSQLQLEAQSTSEAGVAGSSAPCATSAASSEAGVSQNRASSSIRVKKFHRLLDEQLVDLDALRELSWSGIPHELRPVCWRLLLGYLPPNKSRQAPVLARKRREYMDMVAEFYDVENSQRTEDEIGALRQVSVDVPRTAPNVLLFHEPTIQKSLERMLYIWGIRHPASGYVQGMNDLVTPFLAVFLSEQLQGPLETWQPENITEGMMLDIEADCYWCLSKLLEGIQDHYTYAQPGIQRSVFRIKELISKNNSAIVGKLEAEGIDFLQFAFRWVNCLLIREVPFSAAIRLWDTYLAEGGRFSDFLVYVCTAFLACWQKDILSREFQELMMFLQKLPTQDWQDSEIESILSNAFVLRNTWGNAQSHLQA
eukprot:gene5089-5330_t